MAELVEVRRLAKELYLQGRSTEEIGPLCGVDPTTIQRWANNEKWMELRSASNVSRTELRNKLLVVLDNEVKRYNAGQADANMGDTLVKLTTSVKNLDVGISIVDIIEVFTAFTKWMENTAALDPRLTVEFRKQVNLYLDAYVKFKTNE